MTGQNPSLLSKLRGGATVYHTPFSSTLIAESVTPALSTARSLGGWPLDGVTVRSRGTYYDKQAQPKSQQKPFPAAETSAGFQLTDHRWSQATGGLRKHIGTDEK